MGTTGELSGLSFCPMGVSAWNHISIRSVLGKWPTWAFKAGPVSMIFGRSPHCSFDSRGGPLRADVAQAVGPEFVEAVDPDARRLPVHAVENRRRRQKPSALVGMPRRRGEPSQIRSRMVPQPCAQSAGGEIEIMETFRMAAYMADR
jgi:hypothetical protein